MRRGSFTGNPERFLIENQNGRSEGVLIEDHRKSKGLLIEDRKTGRPAYKKHSLRRPKDFLLPMDDQKVF